MMADRMALDHCSGCGAPEGLLKDGISMSPGFCFVCPVGF